MNITHAGMVAVVGRPNAGKSTLINKICGEKVAIVSPKPQTTRRRLSAVFNREPVQMVLLDTPGFHTPRTKLGQFMVKSVRESVGGVDAAVLVAEPVPSVGEIERQLITQCNKKSVPFFLVINKSDTLPREKLLPVIGAYSKETAFDAILPLSAKTGDGVEELTSLLLGAMPHSPALYPEDVTADQTDRELISEVVREKLLICLNDEVPHGAAVTVDKLTERGDGLVSIEAVVTCEKESHKGIVIGKNGAMLKKIGSLARAELEEMYGGPVFLKLWVRVRAGWRDSDAQLRNFGYR
ncbi:MAG: GTPase Era [Oscillospiraceae bacterium]|jgi:GTP-binding protein Era|nr:GTPase Era [Oscillospiraceae bacterium]